MGSTLHPKSKNGLRFALALPVRPESAEKVFLRKSKKSINKCCSDRSRDKVPKVSPILADFGPILADF